MPYGQETKVRKLVKPFMVLKKILNNDKKWQYDYLNGFKVGESDNNVYPTSLKITSALSYVSM